MPPALADFDHAYGEIYKAFFNKTIKINVNGCLKNILCISSSFFAVFIEFGLNPLLNNLFLTKFVVFLDKFEQFFCFIIPKYFLHFDEDSALLSYFCRIWLGYIEE